MSCGTERRYHKKRIDAGNNIPFVYFQKTVSKYDIYKGTEYYKNIPGNADSIEIFLFGSQTEISNKQYSHFLNYLKRNDSIELYNKYKPDSLQWQIQKDKVIYSDSMFQYYNSHKSFLNYPVVNITPEAANAYALWLTKIEPDTLVYYRLFTQQEWLLLFNDNKGVDSSFAWGGIYWRNYYGTKLGNYAEYDQSQIRYNRIEDYVYWENSDSVGYSYNLFGPREVYSYNPNAWGAYNMSGNVAEIILDYFIKDEEIHCFTRGGSWSSPVFYLRKIAKEEYIVPSPFVGFRILKVKIKPNEKK